MEYSSEKDTERTFNFKTSTPPTAEKWSNTMEWMLIIFLLVVILSQMFSLHPSNEIKQLGYGVYEVSVVEGIDNINALLRKEQCKIASISTGRKKLFGRPLSYIVVTDQNNVPPPRTAV